MTDEYRLTVQEQIATAILAGNGHTTVAQALQLADDLLAETRGRDNGEPELDPCRIDPDDLEPGEWVIGWDDDGVGTIYPKELERVEDWSEFPYKMGLGEDRSYVGWQHCRRARPEEIADA
jgi:hypothetical protein